MDRVGYEWFAVQSVYYTDKDLFLSAVPRILAVRTEGDLVAARLSLRSNGEVY